MELISKRWLLQDANKFVVDNSVAMRWFFGDGKPQDLSYPWGVLDTMKSASAIFDESLMTLPILVVAIGNESRGDDALGPLLLRQLQSEAIPQTEFIEDFQLQVEHVTDLAGRDVVLFVDADVSCNAPFEFSNITAAHDNSYSSHAMSPFALLHAYWQFHGAAPPPAFLLRIRGYDFELGAGLSNHAADNLEQATGMICAWLADSRTSRE